MKNEKKLVEGKTKIIRSIEGVYNEVLIESKDQITAGDGIKKDIIENKGVLSNKTTCNCFRLLDSKGVPTHFIAQINDRTFRALLLKMIPIELVTRRIAAGSFLKRNPKTIEGTIFDELVTEFFLKDDSRHDPLMLWNGEKQCFELYDAKLSLKDGYLGELPESVEVPKTFKEVQRLRDISIKVFSILETAWKKQGVSLVDLKIECGYDINDVVFVGDVIDNDSWRIWPEGKKELSPDKQVYRDLEDVTLESLDLIKKNYTWVAEATEKFFNS